MTDVYIQKVLEGDTDAFRFIIREHKDKAYSLAISVVKDEFEAREVVQTAFIKAYTKLDTFKANSRFDTWFYRILINEAFYKLRKLKVNPIPLDNVIISDIPSGVNSTILKMEEDYQRYYINEALKKLPANYSLALRLFYLEEYKINEITQITGWTDSNTKITLHRARIKMKKILTDLFNLDKEEMY
ncbi:MAG: sigma-70 family RNA polymerase sigma factor [Balneolaceae bacterium]